jgi:hypothetical protein
VDAYDIAHAPTQEGSADRRVDRHATRTRVGIDRSHKREPVVRAIRLPNSDDASKQRATIWDHDHGAVKESPEMVLTANEQVEPRVRDAFCGVRMRVRQEHVNVTGNFTQTLLDVRERRGGDRHAGSTVR